MLHTLEKDQDSGHSDGERKQAHGLPHLYPIPAQNPIPDPPLPLTLTPWVCLLYPDSCLPRLS